MKTFVIVAGMPRSGTNLTRKIIGSHSKIAIPSGEFDFFKKHAQGKSVGDILANGRLKQWNIDFSSFYSQPPRDVYVNVLCRYAEQVGKEIPGEKTPLNEFYYDTIREWLKEFDLKFVHVVRNPLDAASSFKHAPFRDGAKEGEDRTFARYCNNWRRSVVMGLARAHANPGGYYVSKYEALVLDPVKEARKLCDFLGVDLEEEKMLNLSDFAGQRDNTSFIGDSVARHDKYSCITKPESRKQHLTGGEIRMVSTVCGELAHALGYIDADFKTFPLEDRYSELGFVQKLKRSIRKKLSC